MRRPGLSGALAAGLLAGPGAAQAHLVNSGLGPFYDGALHLLLSPADMLGQDVLCPECHVQFRLRERDSVEYQQKRALAEQRREKQSAYNEAQRLPAWVFGADLTVRWEPTDRMRYADLEWAG